MLLELSIKDYILIDSAQISFSEGLNILTGETGAGKSMVIGALELLMGKKASSGDIYLGAEKALITATFDADSRISEEFELEDDLVILSREIRRDGRSIARLNNRPIPLQTLKQITGYLVRIHGQNEQLELFNKDYQLKMLDSFAKHGMNAEVQESYHILREAEETVNRLTKTSSESDSRVAYLKFQCEEINNAKLTPGEDEELEREFSYLMSIEKIVEAAGAASQWLTDSDFSAASSASEVARGLKKVAELSDETRELYEYASEAERILNEFSGKVAVFLENIERDGSRTLEVERRLDLINTLKRKYGNTIEEILKKGEQLESEIYALENSVFELEKAEERYRTALERYTELAGRLTALRKKAAAELSHKILEQLSQLNMREARLEIQLEESEISALGMDDVDIRIATAVGHQLNSLKKVVSGGELSRIMLAIQVINGGEHTMLFDEVDAGISGNTATVVGEKLAKLSKNNQLVCITHLPQIAVFADRHIFIEKSSDDLRTKTNVGVLRDDERKFEIARLVGGTVQSDTTMMHAEEMLRLAKEKKMEI
ncbi:MAG: DNA repair protein RecN [Bacillota bacterium]|nr:DNA repair protein RecN [Bacillota bacterium]